MNKIIDLQYFPNVNYINSLSKNENIVFPVYDCYRKMSFFNKCYIFGANGLIQLSVPLKGGRNQKALISDIKIDYSTKWQLQHWRSITSAYSKSPFFDFYADAVERLIFSKPEYLFELNLSILEWLNKVLKLSLSFKIVDEQITADEHLYYKWLPKNFQSETYIRYPQIFEDRLGFQPNLSFLDMLFCTGPQMANLLKAH